MKKSFLFTALLSVSLLLSGLAGAKADPIQHWVTDATGGCIIQAHVGNQLELILDSSWIYTDSMV